MSRSESSEAVVQSKIERMRAGGRPRALDLFAGCGGFSLGFHRAGCEIVAGVELDRHAARSHAVNFHGELRSLDPELFALHSKPRDITRLDPLDFMRSLGHTEPRRAIDVLVGGPPCPAFTRVGRAKLREIHDHPEAFKHDPRGKLYLPYLRFVEELQPVMLVMENVPDILNYGGHNLAEEICEVLEDGGYETAYTLLNAANYGVPEMRERFILIGIHRLVGVDPRGVFPEPQNHVRFPAGYQGARDVALKILRQQAQPDLNTAPPKPRFVKTPSQEHLDPTKSAPITAHEALGDLPSELRHLDGSLKKGRRDLSDTGAVAYPADARDRASDYVSTQMWNWPGFESGPERDHIRAHVIRSLSNRDYRIFREMEPGWQYPEAYRLALRLFSGYVEKIRGAGVLLPDEAVPGIALRDVCAQLVQELLARERGSAKDRVAAVLTQWKALRALVDEHARRKRAYDDVLRHLRTNEALPEASAVRTDVQARWAEILECLEASAEGRQPDLHWVKPASIRRYRRLLDSYSRGMEVLGVAPLGAPPLDAASHLGTPVLARSLKAHEEAWADAGVPDGALEATRIAWGVVQFSHILGEHLALKHQFVPPYDPGKFPNKWRKMEPDWPARTLMAHLGKDSYSHIHYDNTQARTISVREAARLQSFPDGFRFQGSMNPGFRQIGNAVPPLFSFAMARSLLTAVAAAGGVGTAQTTVGATAASDDARRPSLVPLTA